MVQLNIINQSSSLILIIIISLGFVIFGVLYSKKYQGLENYLVANRSVGVFSLTTSLVASALGAWILFGPASAATWGGIGAVIGYALGTAFPLFILIFLGEKFRKLYPKGKTLIEVVRLRFGTKLFKLILFLTIFYMFIFLIAEVTAVSILVNYISGTTLWITAFNFNEFNLEFIKQNKPDLLSFDYLPNFTAGLTFFIAVAATNLFHQGNWQRVYAAQNNKVLKKSLIVSFLIIIPIVFFMGFSGLVAVSINSTVVPDLAFFSLLLKEQTLMLSVIVIVLAISLTISSIDTLINAISSLIVVDGSKVLNFKGDYLKLSKYFIICLSIIAFAIASKGLSILYLFLLADLLCCAAVLTVFYSFYDKKLNEKNAYLSILIGLFVGLILFPSPDFSKSILIGILFPVSSFPTFMTQSLLFLSFLFATFLPIFTWKLK